LSGLRTDLEKIAEHEPSIRKKGNEPPSGDDEPNDEEDTESETDEIPAREWKLFDPKEEYE